MQVMDFILPNNDELVLEAWSFEQGNVVLHTHATQREKKCPDCGASSERVHSRYVRTLRDLPCSVYGVQLVWCVRRFFCGNASCHRVTFAEQLPSIAARYARCTVRVSASVRQVGFAVGGQGGHRMLKLFHLCRSRDSILRTIRQTPEAEVQAPRILGIDDWAMRKGHTYGTILVDLETHRVVDLLPKRDHEQVAQWLQSHPGSEIVTRDRGTDYIEGVSQGAPTAIQVADRFHLLGNLREVIQRLFERSHSDLKRAASQLAQCSSPAAEGSEPAALLSLPDDKPALNTECAASQLPPISRREKTQRPLSIRERKYTEVMALHGQGLSQREIGRRVGLNPRTVKKYLLADSLPPRGVGRQNLSKVLPFEQYLLRRWNDGSPTLTQLWQELKAQGFSGSYASVRRAVAHLPAPDANRQHTPQIHVHPLSAKQASWLLVLPPEKLTEKQAKMRRVLCETSPVAATAYALAHQFRSMIHAQSSDTLDTWLHQAEAAGIVEFKRFAQSLRSDYQAVQAAFQLSWSNGQTEGQVNRLKLLKRQMYGRAKFDLLRKRVLGLPAPT